VKRTTARNCGKTLEKERGPKKKKSNLFGAILPTSQDEYGKVVLEQLHRCTVQQILDEEKLKHASLAQQNGFSPAFLHKMLKCPAKPNTCC
jgi:hypothetical protein